MDWILDAIDWVGEKVEEFLVSIMSPEEAEMYVKLKEEEANENKKNSASLFSDDLEARTGTSSGTGITGMMDDNLRLKAREASAGQPSVLVAKGKAAASAAGDAIASRFNELREITEMQKAAAAAGGAPMSVDVSIDGAVIAKANVKHSARSRARSYSSLPADGEED